MRHPQPDGFDGLRQQLERRRQAQYAELLQALGEVDAEAFIGATSGGSGATPDFSVCGALPPTSSRRGPDTAAVVAIGRAEKQAAKELIAQQSRSDRDRNDGLARSVTGSRPRSAQKRPPGPPAYAAAALGTDQKTVAAEEEQQLLPCTPPRTPMSRGWERDLLAFYQRADRRGAEERVASARSTAGDEREAHEAEVRERLFERHHKRREAAIEADSRRLLQQHHCRQYQVELDTKLGQANREREAELEAMRDRIQQRKDVAAKRRGFLDVKRDFMLKQGMIDRTCRQVDAQRLKAATRADNASKVGAIREETALRSRQVESHKVLDRALQLARDMDERDRHAFLMKMREAGEKQETTYRKQRVQAQRTLDAFVREARTELMSQEGDAMACSEVQEYERTLAAFRDLALDVRAQGARMQAAMQRQVGASDDSDGFSAGDNPLLPAETRVRQLIAAASELGREDGDAYTGTDLLGDRSSAASLVEDLVEEVYYTAQDEGEETVEDEVRNFSATLVPVLPSVVPPLPLSMAVVPMPSSPAQRRLGTAEPVAGRQLRTFGRQAAALAAPFSDRPSLRDMQGLAALRRLRRTGPFAR